MRTRPTREEIERIRSKLYENGYQPVAVCGPEMGGKKPLANGWQKLTSVPPWDPDTTNTGINCCGLRAIDIDVDELDAAGIRDLVLARLGPALVRTRPNSGRTLLLYRAAESTPGKKTILLDCKPTPPGRKPPRVDQVEVLGAGQQFVAFGVHETWVPLEWLDASPLDTPRDQLTPVTEEQIEALLAEIFEQFATPAAKAKRTAEEDKVAPKLTKPACDAPGGEWRRAWAEARLRGEMQELAQTGEGSRNDRLNRAVFKCAQCVPHSLLSEDEIAAAAEEACRTNGLAADRKSGGMAGVRRTIHSAIEDGKARPYPVETIGARRQAESDCKGRRADVGGQSTQRSRLVPVGTLLAPTIRDRIDLDDDDLPAARFPIEALPPVMRGAVEALEEHVQAPRALCAHSILSAAALAAQGHRNVHNRAIGSMQLSLFMLAIARAASASPRVTTSRCAPLQLAKSSCRQPTRRISSATRPKGGPTMRRPIRLSEIRT